MPLCHSWDPLENDYCLLGGLQRRAGRGRLPSVRAAVRGGAGLQAGLVGGGVRQHHGGGVRAHVRTVQGG